jgi:hypothetical protein
MNDFTSTGWGKAQSHFSCNKVAEFNRSSAGSGVSIVAILMSASRRSEVPPGLKLHAHSGAISGVPATSGEYRFTVAVADSSVPPLQAQRAMTITVIAGLTIDWKQSPKVQGTTLSGSVVVTNQTGQNFDLTVVVVAVNSIGRATTLGYQHFTLAAQKSGPVIPFGSSPGPGSYVVHADAVAHHPSGHHIYRARKQTSQPLPITQIKW